MRYNAGASVQKWVDSGYSEAGAGSTRGLSNEGLRARIVHQRSFKIVNKAKPTAEISDISRMPNRPAATHLVLVLLANGATALVRFRAGRLVRLDLRVLRVVQVGQQLGGVVGRETRFGSEVGKLVVAEARPGAAGAAFSLLDRVVRRELHRKRWIMRDLGVAGQKISRSRASERE